MSAGNLLQFLGGPILSFALLANTVAAQSQSPQTPQTPPPAGGGTPGTTTPTTPTRPTIPTQPTTPQQPAERTPFPEIQRPIFLSGKVMMEDGTAPPESVTIERVCNGVARPEAYTDGKGHFSFQLGENMHVFADASVGSAADSQFGGRPGGMSGPMGGRGFSERDLMNCELRASLPGFRSTVVSLSGRRVMDNPEVGTILLHRMGNVEGLTISATTAMAPKDARKAFDKARDLMKKNKLPEAQKNLEKAVEVYPKFATAWYNLGLVREQQKDIEGARKAYGQSLAADAKYVNPYLQLAQISAQENNWQDVADASSCLLKLNPYDFPRAWFLNAVANYNLKKFDAAEESARSAVKNDPDNRIPKAHHLLGIILAQKQEYAAAATEMQSYLKFAPKATDIELVKKQLSDIEKLAPKQETADKQ